MQRVSGTSRARQCAPSGSAEISSSDALRQRGDSRAVPASRNCRRSRRPCASLRWSASFDAVGARAVRRPRQPSSGPCRGHLNPRTMGDRGGRRTRVHRCRQGVPLPSTGEPWQSAESALRRAQPPESPTDGPRQRRGLAANSRCASVRAADPGPRQLTPRTRPVPRPAAGLPSSLAATEAARRDRGQPARFSAGARGAACIPRCREEARP